MDFADYPEHAAIRDTVAAITRSFGSSYYSAHAEGRIATDELWAALARQGFVGINLPERFGGGGAGLAELALVCEETLSVAAALPEQQFTLYFDGVRVGADQLVGDENDGFTQVFHGLNPERITGAAICVGIGRYALARAAEYARHREVWGVPIGTHQGVSHPLAKAKIEVELAALMTAKAAWLHDHGQPAGEASNMAKYAAAEAALAAVDAAIQTHGGNGLAAEYGLVPLWSVARLLRIAPVNREMILNYVAGHSLGLPRSY